MIKNILKTAFRGLAKNKGFTAINVLGLASGLAICLLITFYVFDELSYDRYNIKADRIYRLNTDLKTGGSTTQFAITAPPVGEAMVSEFPEVEGSVRIALAINIQFKKGDEIITENKAVYCDHSIFDIFTLPMLSGDPKTALKNPNAIVISESAAKKYFNTTNVIGRTLISVNNENSLHKITGVIKDMPAQSHFRADFFLALDANQSHNWMGFSFNTYILVKPGADVKRLESRFDGLIRRHMNTDSFSYDKFASGGDFIRLSLTPLTDIHLKSNRQRELSANGDIQYIYIFLAIAVFVLVLACVNFMNLSTARSANRAREVGVRKVLGSPRKYLVAQFLSESVLVTLASSVIAILLAWALLPLFNQLSGKDMALSLQIFSWLIPALLVIVFVVGVLAGAYPAFFLSAFQPISVLNGKLSSGFRDSALRSFLVVFQFSISIFLIVGTLVVYNQLSYIKSKDLGFNRSQVLVIKNANAVSNPNTLRQEMKHLPGVINASLSSFLPTGVNRWPNQLSLSSGSSVQSELWTVDENYLNTMGMQLTEGRNFSDKFLSDSSAMIINQTAAKKLGYKGDPTALVNKRYRIIGVVKDFNFSSLRDNVTPLAMVMAPDWMASLNVKLQTGNLPQLMERIENKWKTLAPGQQFEYSFMDDDFNAMYSNEQRMEKLFFIFTALALGIACLGLFALAAYAAEQRRREISIRKVLGANVSTLVSLLSKDFIRLVLIAIFISVPLAWWVMHQWLQSFAYRQNIPWWAVASAATGTIIIAFATISFQSVKAAMAKPVDSLRGE
ncbi:ABC transporter permease [Mucilaginibacter ginsenosidivorans]|uniref:FtsX-like permease family protein n=1 Tax=Mucilaginibacter ginsenosidivorans TaxID=398053 RepID=A0A5B8UX95_9SPHI|nr:ABC transporter permease [Mucilaginibacter ginsenosidivorans]QEC63777.1 FtsX-like permease family protein [Mucilaginibacter ginsenosidivorans]